MIEAVLFDWADTLVSDGDGDAGGPTVLASAQALLEALQARGIKTGVVAASSPVPGAFGLAAHLDVIVASEDSPPGPILHACRELDVQPFATMFVGNDLADVQEAANVGMTTVQALWFSADDTPGFEPDFMAFTPMDVLNAVRRLAP
jgi:beta-phosphoglucomutase-like phosphatase (HAD superfamily)